MGRGKNLVADCTAVDRYFLQSREHRPFEAVAVVTLERRMVGPFGVSNRQSRNTSSVLSIFVAAVSSGLWTLVTL
jgi:hypothetical protein